MHGIVISIVFGMDRVLLFFMDGYVGLRSGSIELLGSALERESQSVGGCGVPWAVIHLINWQRKCWLKEVFMAISAQLKVV